MGVRFVSDCPEWAEVKRLLPVPKAEKRNWK